MQDKTPRLRTSRSSLRVSLQVRTMVVLAAAVVMTMVAGGWAYHHLVSRWVLEGHVDEANRLANALQMTIADHLARGNRQGLARVARAFLHHENVLHLSIVDENESQLLNLSRAGQGRPRDQQIPPSVSRSMEMASTEWVGNDRLIVVRPVVADIGGGKRRVGAIRLSLDTSEVSAKLARAHTTVLLLACGVLVCSVVLANVLLRRVLVLPIRRLASATACLAEGDLSARATAGRKDEIGLLAESFNAMAKKIEAQHGELLLANEQLETKVQQRAAELSHANARLRVEIADRENLVRAVSHDLSAPLRNIAGMATMLQMKWRDVLPHEVLARLERIRANVDAERQMIGELLELSHIRTRSQERQPVAVAPLLEQVRASLEFDLRNKNVDLYIAPNMPTLHVERHRLRQAFMNLVDNAIKYMGDRADGRIEITYELSNGEHVFHVADNGPGIAPEDQARIFTVFRRGADSGQVHGKGIGLAAVKTIVGKYEGRVWVDSTLGAGATFHVALPAAAARPIGAHSSAAGSQGRDCDHAVVGQGRRPHRPLTVQDGATT